jgi:hypothetical protein
VAPSGKGKEVLFFIFLLLDIAIPDA